MIHFLARPHVLSWLFALAWFWILDSTESGWTADSPRAMVMGITAVDAAVGECAWRISARVCAVGDLLAGIALDLGSTRGRPASRTRCRRSQQGQRVRQLTGVGLLSIAATFVNPYGWKLHAHIYSYLSNRFLMDHIDEFQSPNFHGIAQKCFLALLLIAVAALAARGRKLRLSEILLVLFAVYAGLYASRNIPVSSMLLVLHCRAAVAFARESWGFVQRMSAVDSRLRGHLWPVFATAAVLLIAANGGRVGSSQWMDAHFDAKRMPVEAVNFLEHSGVRASGAQSGLLGRLSDLPALSSQPGCDRRSA